VGDLDVLGDCGRGAHHLRRPGDRLRHSGTSSGRQRPARGLCRDALGSRPRPAPTSARP
jgi:hypothetical protein